MISVSPAKTSLDLAKNPPEFFLTYQNQTQNPVQINLTAKDFSGLGDSGQINFLDDANPDTFKYSLSNWLDFSPKNFLLLPGKSQKVKVSIRTFDLIPGGHYGAIIANLQNPDTLPQAPIAIQNQLVSLVFVRTHTGQERPMAKIKSFKPDYSPVFQLPSSYSFQLDNTGNTDLTPRGLIIVKDFLNREISRGIVNERGFAVLPESIRRLNVPIIINQPAYRLPGLYQSTLTVTYDPSSPPLVSHYQFLSFGNQTNLIIFTAILFLSFLLLRKLTKPK